MVFYSTARGRSRLRALLLAASAAGLAAGAASAQEAAPAAASRTVDINEYFVEGNTVLADPEIEQAVYPFLGPGRTLDDVEKARAALQKAYEAKGLKTVFVEIPQQNVVGGRVRLVVTETRVGKIVVEGGRHTSGKAVLSALPAVTPGKAPDLDAFSTQLTALNSRSADRQVTPQLKAGAEPGTVDVDLQVEDKLPLHGSLEFNNRYSQGATQDRVAASLRYDDVFGLGHSISAYYSVAPQRKTDAEVFVGAYGLPFSDTLRLDVTGLVSNSDVNTVGSTNVLGNGHSVTAVLTKTLPSGKGLYHRVTASVAWKDFKEDATFGEQTSKAPITYYPLALGYAGTWTTGAGTLGFDLTGNFAFRGLGSSLAQFDNKRFRATGGFAYVHGGLNWLWSLPAGAQLYSAVEGQVSSEALISNEQMALGGDGSVRGYLQSEAIGDNAISGTVELRSPSLARFTGPVLDELRLFGFVDAGRVSLIDPLPEQKTGYDLASAGAGVRLKMLGRLNGEAALGTALRDGQTTKAGDTRLHFRISTDF